jgi:hypothetical protein
MGVVRKQRDRVQRVPDGKHIVTTGGKELEQQRTIRAIILNNKNFHRVREEKGCSQTDELPRAGQGLFPAQREEFYRAAVSHVAKWLRKGAV